MGEWGVELSLNGEIDQGWDHCPLVKVVNWQTGETFGLEYQ